MYGPRRAVFRWQRRRGAAEVVAVDKRRGGQGATHGTHQPVAGGGEVGASYREGRAHVPLSKAVTSAALEAASSSTRGGGWGPSGPASFWESRAAKSRLARPEEAQEPS